MSINHILGSLLLLWLVLFLSFLIPSRVRFSVKHPEVKTRKEWARYAAEGDRDAKLVFSYGPIAMILFVVLGLGLMITHYLHV